jgi:penicillin-binding protein-related factor A (putative recombinase)
MKESDLNTIIRNSFLKKGNWCFKIPDPQGMAAMSSSKSPFDLFGLTTEYVFYWESKLIKHEYSAFSFSSIEPHQLENLKKIKDLVKGTPLEPFVLTVVVLGVWIPRKSWELFIFDIDFILKEIESGNKSVKKKQLLDIREKKSILISKDLTFDYREVPLKLIDSLEGLCQKDLTVK